MSTSGTLIFAAALALCAGCKSATMMTTPGIAMTPSAEVAAAKGTVRTDRDDANNTRIMLDVEHLAAPERISQKAKVYVVWVEPLETAGKPQNVGAFQVDADAEGDLETMTTLRQFDLYITPEADSTVSAPTERPVLSTTVR